MKLPQEFLDKMRALMAEDEYNDFIRAVKAKIMVHSLRVNTLKISVEEFRRVVPYELEPVPWCREGFYLPKGFKASKHPYYYAGLYYLQDPSAMLPGAVLSPEPGQRVIDLCAAPGGKSTQLGAAMNGRGLLFLNDINVKRIKALIKNVENFGIRNAVITNNNPKELAERFPGFFDRVLVDAPCSGEGMFRRESRLVTAWRRNYHPSRCVPLQREILEYAAAMVAPGGRLVYSTCTFSPEENEGQLRGFLRRHRDFRLVGPGMPAGISRGRGEWVGDESLNRAVRIWPHLSRGEGQFAAALQREGAAGPGREKEEPKFPHREPDEREIGPFRSFCAEVGIKVPQGRLLLLEGNLYLLPEGFFTPGELKVIRFGLLLGQLSAGRFQPSQALALALGRREAERALELPSEGPEVFHYLKGETLLLDEKRLPGNGWMLVTTDGFPLGWAKRVGRLIKNHYPAAWRLV